MAENLRDKIQPLTLLILTPGGRAGRRPFIYENKIYFIYLLVLSMELISCGTPTKAIPVKDLPFESIFTTSPKDTLHTYCLLGTGYFRAPMAKNTDSLIQDWIKKHPKALAIPISTDGPTLINHPESKNDIQ